MILKFTVQPTKWPASIVMLEYWLDTSKQWKDGGGSPGVLKQVLFNDDCDDQTKKALLQEVPIYIHWQAGVAVPDFEMWRRAGCAVKDESVGDTGFERFWNAYGYKVGNKARVAKKWNALGEGDRLLALGAIARYKRFAEGKKIDRVYPETYIDQRRWENEF